MESLVNSVAQPNPAFGQPGIPPRWTRSSKNGIGTAYHTSSRLWFTINHGIVSELYFPFVDRPCTRDMEFIITDGETFLHEEKRDLSFQLEYPQEGALYYRITSQPAQGQYRLIKDIISDPHAAVLLVRTRLEILDNTYQGKIKIYALLAPHIGGMGQHNHAWTFEMGWHKLLAAARNDCYLVFGTNNTFLRTSVGYVGSSDGWQDLIAHKTLTWNFTQANDGNVALVGEVDLSQGLEFVTAVSFGFSQQAATTKLIQSLSEPFEKHLQTFLDQWKRTTLSELQGICNLTGDGGRLFRLSRSVLLAHEDKTFQGAMIASLSIPWGEIKDDQDLGGYHLVWTRDMVQSATALLAAGKHSTPLRTLVWLVCSQQPDGHFPQNSWINGTPYWRGLQLDEVAAPILLAWRLNQIEPLTQIDVCTMMLRAARFLILQGPVTQEERWEENAGYSPSTLAYVIAGLVCAAEFTHVYGRDPIKQFLLDYADWLVAHLETWMVTTQGELVPGHPRHYVRINPADPVNPDPHADVNTMILNIANGGGQWPARNVVGGDFLQLVRLGILSPEDATVKASIEVIDAVLKKDLPQGPAWLRYNHDGYGQKEDGTAFDGTGIGRRWPLLTGERAHYELAAGKDVGQYIRTLEAFTHEGGMLAEQLWDEADIDAEFMRFGGPTGSAMPLCWSHAEYMCLVRSAHDGKCFDQIEPVYQRYVNHKPSSQIEYWTFRFKTRFIEAGKTLRIITDAPAQLHWSLDGWQSTKTDPLEDSGIDLWFIDLALDIPGNIVFTFFWPDSQHWEGQDFLVKIVPKI